MPTKVWKILQKTSDDLLEQLLANRGITSEKQRQDFVSPTLDTYAKDVKIPNIPVALKRIKKAIENEELIIVYGDYDVDGICASAILFKALTAMGAKVLPYIPHREKEGYGLSNQGLEYARDSGASLVITVDNGIVAFNQAKFAKEIGLDLIITDHHTPLDSLPEAYTIVHAMNMCGAGVAWCLIQEEVSEKLRKELLQFVAIATIGDMIPLLNLARAFVYEGIKVLNKTENPGLLALMHEAGLLAGTLTSYEIGHILVPRLNAIGRLEHAIDALRLLCTKDPTKARKLAKLLCDTNLLRQQLTVSAIEEARALIGTSSTKKIHVLDSKNWNPGIIGLIAARVCEEHYRPAIAISIGETVAKGSARSSNGINIVEVIRQCSDILIDVGGHKGAAGFSIAPENIGIFRERLEKIMDEQPDEIEQIIEIEAEVESKKLTKALAKEIAKLEPFGFGNAKPLLMTKVMKVTSIRTLSAGKHLKLKADGIDTIAFGMGDLATIITEGSLVDIAYYLEINKFNGNEYLQLKVRDLKLSSQLD